jgi:hypothetical protein
LVRFVNFAGAKVKNSILKVSDVIRLSVRLSGVVSLLGNTGGLLSEVAEVVQVANRITCVSYVPNNAPEEFMEF